jgi:hypothetical protein
MPYDADERMELADVRSDLKLLKWVQGATFAGVVALIFRLFVH